jgi:hypothetical protein
MLKHQTKIPSEFAPAVAAQEINMRKIDLNLVEAFCVNLDYFENDPILGSAPIFPGGMAQRG